jgi:nucleotide-binding universal stress UspA family protein
VPVELVVVSAPGLDPEADRAELVDRAARLGQCGLTTVVLQNLDAVAALNDFAAGTGRLLCMATHGRGGIARSFLGSVAQGVAGAAHDPLVLVGPRVDDVPDRFSTLVVGVDPAVPPGHLLSVVVGVAKTLAAAVHLVSVEESSHWLFLGTPPVGPRLDRLVSEAADEVRAQGVEVTTTVVRVGRPALALADIAAQCHGCLLVMSSRSIDPEYPELSATTTRTAHLAASPVLVVPPAKPRH